MPDLDKIRDAAVLILQGRKDWMSATEIYSRINSKPELGDVVKVMMSMSRGNKLAEEREIEEGGVKKKQWKATNMFPTAEDDTDNA